MLCATRHLEVVPESALVEIQLELPVCILYHKTHEHVAPANVADGCHHCVNGRTL